ncbi:hypothetical protein [Streptomyces hydrogenans]
MAAGFDLGSAGCGLALLAEFSYASARDAFLVGREGDHPRMAEVRDALARESLDAYPAVRSLADAGLMSRAAARSDLDVDVFIAGMEQRLPTRGS